MGEGAGRVGGTPTHPSPTPLRRRGREGGRYSHSPFSHSTPEKGQGGWEVLPLTLLPLHSGEGAGRVGGTPTHPSPTPLRRRGREGGRYSHSPFSHSTPEKGQGGWEVLPLTLLPLHSGEGAGRVGGTPTHPSPTPLRRRGREGGRYSHSPFSHSTPEKGQGGWEVLPLTLLPLHSGEGAGRVGGTPTHPSPTPLRRRGREGGRYSHSPFSHSTPEKGQGGWEVLPLTLLPLHSGEGAGRVEGTPTHPSPTPLRRRGREGGRYSHSPFSHSTPEKGQGGWKVLPLTLLPLHSGEGAGRVEGTPTHPSPTPLRRRGREGGRYSHSPFSHSTPEKGQGGWKVLPLTLLPLHSGEGAGRVEGTPTHPSPTPLRRRGREGGRYSHSPFSHSTPEKGQGGWKVLPLTLLPLHSGEGAGRVEGTPTHPSPTPLRRRGREGGRYSHSPFSHSTPEKGQGGWKVLPLTLLPLHSGEGAGRVEGTPTHPSPTPLRRRGREGGRYSHSPFSHSTPEKGQGGWKVLPLTLLPLHSGEGAGRVEGTPTHPSPTPLRRRGREGGRYSHSPFSHSTPEKGQGGWKVLPLTLLPLHSGEGAGRVEGTPTHPSPTPLRRRGREGGRYSHSPFSHSTPEKGQGGWKVLPLTLLPLHSGEGAGRVEGTPTHPSPTPLRRRGREGGRYSHSPFSHSTPEKGQGGWKVLPLTLLPLHSGEGAGRVEGTPTHPSRVNLFINSEPLKGKLRHRDVLKCSFHHFCLHLH